jgi:hypothetical protein
MGETMIFQPGFGNAPPAFLSSSGPEPAAQRPQGWQPAPLPATPKRPYPFDWHRFAAPVAARLSPPRLSNRFALLAGALVLPALLSGCSGGHGDHPAPAQTVPLVPLTNLAPAPATEGELEVGAGVAASSAPLPAASDRNGSTTLPAGGGSRQAAFSTLAGPLAAGIADMQHIADGLPGQDRIAPLSSANPGDAAVLGRARENRLNPRDNTQSVRIKGVDGRPFATGKWSKGFFYQSPTRLDAYFAPKPADTADPRFDPRNVIDNFENAIFAFPNKLWLDDRIGMVTIAFPKRRYIALERDPASSLYDLTNTYVSDYVLYTVTPDVSQDMRLTYLPEPEGRLARQIDRFDELTVSTTWKSAGGEKAMQLIAAEGSPYVTVRYQNLRPVVQIGQGIQARTALDSGGAPIAGTTDYNDWQSDNQIVAVATDENPAQPLREFNRTDGSRPPDLSGTKFRFIYRLPSRAVSETGTNDNVTRPERELLKEALVYTSQPVTLQWDAARRSYAAAAPFTGVVRAVFVDDVPGIAPPDDNQALDLSGTPSFVERRAILDRFAQAYPVLSEVRLDYPGGPAAKLKYQWAVQRMDGAAAAPQDLLMAGFEKTHLASLDSSGNAGAPTPATDALTFRSNFGAMRAVVGDNWVQRIDIPSILRNGATAQALWFGARPMPAGEDRSEILAALQEDARLFRDNLAHCNDESYKCGKYMNNIGRAILIADELGAVDIRDDLLAFMKQTLQPWFDGVDPTDPTYENNPIKDNFLYDTTNGGVITERGSKAFAEDYYNGVYTDHMFHYGYFIFASAVISRYDSVWFNANKEKVNALVRDIANPSHADPWFPVIRTFDWFRLQNFADSGPTANGPNTESSSESINSNYALALWGVVTGNTEFQALAAVMTGAEIRTAQAFYQITPQNTAFADVTVPQVTVRTPSGPRQFSLDPKGEIAAGILFQDITQTNVYFGGLEHNRVGIQLLPISPISGFVFSPQWLRAHAGRLRDLEDKQTVLFESIVNQVPSRQSTCVQALYPERPPREGVNFGALCATSLQNFASWRHLIVAANGVNDPQGTWRRFLDYRKRLPAQEETYKANTARSRHPGASLNDDGVVADVRKSQATPSTDTNTLWWLATRKP